MRKRIMELVSGNSSLIPVSEDQFWMFGKYAKLQNSTIVVWVSYLYIFYNLNKYQYKKIN